MFLRLFLALAPVTAILSAQTIEAVPSRIPVDEPASFRAGGLQPGERATIRAELTDGDGVHWTSQADFVADAQGIIDTAKQPPAKGSYKDVSAAGLIWSMTPSSHKIFRYRPPREFGVQTVEIHLLGGNREVASARLEQAFIAEGVQKIDVHEGMLRGTLFLPGGSGPHPGVLVLGGSEGGMPSSRAAWLASRGFAALALAYFRHDDLPRELAGIPLEYFGTALNWMAHRPEIAPDRIGVMGMSRGAELALQVASMVPGVRAVVAYSPADVRFPACCGATPVPWAWTWHGQPLAWRPVRGFSPQEAMRATIEVERIHGPVLLTSGEADRVWDSPAMADSIVRRLKRDRFAYEAVHLNYPHAGHSAGLPEIVPAWQGEVRHPLSGQVMEMGGTPEGDAKASLDAIPRVLDFLRRSLEAH